MSTHKHKVLLLGASGYVGSAFVSYLKAQNIPFVPLSRYRIDYTQPLLLAPFIKEQNITFLINAAGYTGKPNVDACELHKTETLLGNAVLPGLIEQACFHAGIPWGHVSSGCIFSGNSPNGQGFTESYSPNFTFRQNNCSFYSGSKALGEEVLQSAKSTYIWRLRIPFNNVNSPRNYLSKLLNYEKLVDVRNTISNLDDFVRAACFCFLNNLPYGTYNIVNPGSLTTREVVELIQQSGLSQKTFKFFSSEEEFMSTVAKTPRSNCVLSPQKIINLGATLPPAIDSIKVALKNWIP